MLLVNRPVLDITHSQSSNFAIGVKIKVTGELKLSYSSVHVLASCFSFECNKFDIIVSTLTLTKFILQVMSWGHGGCLGLCIAVCQVHEVSVCNNIALIL